MIWTLSLSLPLQNSIHEKHCDNAADKCSRQVYEETTPRFRDAKAAAKKRAAPTMSGISKRVAMYREVEFKGLPFPLARSVTLSGKNCKCSALESYLSLRPIKEAMGRKRHAS